MHISDDMNDPEAAARLNYENVVSIRDMMIFLGIPDEYLRDCDDMDEILKREPWRLDGIKRRGLFADDFGRQWTACEGSINWSGTRFDTKPKGD